MTHVLRVFVSRCARTFSLERMIPDAVFAASAEAPLACISNTSLLLSIYPPLSNGDPLLQWLKTHRFVNKTSKMNTGFWCSFPTFFQTIFYVQSRSLEVFFFCWGCERNWSQISHNFGLRPSRHVCTVCRRRRQWLIRSTWVSSSTTDLHTCTQVGSVPTKGYSMSCD